MTTLNIQIKVIHLYYYHSLEDLIIIKNACIMNRAKSVDEEDDLHRKKIV